MTAVRRLCTQAMAVALMAPLLTLALACQAPQTNMAGAMACCRGMHSSCMHGENAGSMACCSQVTAPPVLALSAHSPQPAPAAEAVALVPPRPAAIVPADRFLRERTSLPAETPPLYTLHASLLI